MQVLTRPKQPQDPSNPSKPDSLPQTRRHSFQDNGEIIPGLPDLISSLEIVLTINDDSNCNR
jgi:hypothetical protein